jgi:hypothetical protein
MNNIKGLNEIENLIGVAKTEIAISKLLSLIEKENNPNLESYKGDTLLLSSQYHFYKENCRKGILNDNEVFLSFNKINHQLLEVVSALRKETKENKIINQVAKPEYFELELKLTKKIEEFSIVEQRQFLDKIRTLLSLGNNLKIKQIEVGSIKIKIALPKEKVEVLLKLIEKGEFADYNLVEVVLLCDIEGYTYQEISELLNIPIGLVRARLFRGRMLLKKLNEIE